MPSTSKATEPSSAAGGPSSEEDRIDADGYLRHEPDAGELFEWKWVGPGTRTRGGDISYAAVTRDEETLSVGDFVLIMPSAKDKPCDIGQVVTLYERRPEAAEDEPLKLFTARWLYRKEELSADALKQVSPLRSAQGREVWLTDRFDTDNALDSVERKCFVSWVPSDTDDFKAVVEEPCAFFYSRILDPTGQRFTLAQEGALNSMLRTASGHFQRNPAMQPAEKITHPCPICGQAFSTRTTLKKHHERKHSAERKHECIKCGLALKTKADQTQHESMCLKGRDEGKAICCTTCNMELSGVDQWKNHRKHSTHPYFEIRWPTGPKEFGEVLEDDDAVELAQGRKVLTAVAVRAVKRQRRHLAVAGGGARAAVPAS